MASPRSPRRAKTRKCQRCGKREFSRYLQCASCREFTAAYQAEKRAEAMAEGYCSVCQKDVPAPDKTMCEACLVHRRNRNRAARARARERGVCTLCCRRPAANGFKQCRPCRRTVDKWRNRDRVANWRAGRGANRLLDVLRESQGPMTLKQFAERAGRSTRQILRVVPRLTKDGFCSVVESGPTSDAFVSHQKLYYPGSALWRLDEESK